MKISLGLMAAALLAVVAIQTRAQDYPAIESLGEAAKAETITIRASVGRLRDREAAFSHKIIRTAKRHGGIDIVAGLRGVCYSAHGCTGRILSRYTDSTICSLIRGKAWRWERKPGECRGFLERDQNEN